MTPADELRTAAAKERDIWVSTMTSGQFLEAQAIHLAVAGLLDHIANDMDDANAIELTHDDGAGGIYTAIHPSDNTNVFTPIRHDWTAALKAARAINGGAE